MTTLTPTGITIVLRDNHTDSISLKFPTLPYPIVGYPREHLHLDTEATIGTGEDYCRRYFPGVPIEIVDARHGGRRPSRRPE